MPALLSHVRVLDLSRVLAGPWASQLLADLGADVVKVERPGEGDDTRAWGPPFLKDLQGAETRQGGYFIAANRGKKSITLELSAPEAQEIVRRLAAESDVVIENFKVGTLKRFGLDYESLSALNPRLVYCSVTGFGQTGPRKSEPAYDFLIQAIGGLMSVTGASDAEGGGPTKVGVPIVDLVTGVYATVGILAAINAREVTGRGEYVDVAMLDVQVGLLCNQAMNHLIGGKLPGRTGNAHPNIQPQQVFQASDAAFVVVVGNDGQFASLCRAIGRPELSSDPRFVTNGMRVTHKSELTPLLEEAFARGSRAEWLRRLSTSNVPCGPINTIPEVFADEQVKHRGMLRELTHQTAGKVPQVGCPLRFGGEQAMSDRAPPELGADTEAVLASIGVSAEQLQALRASGIV
ncbi:MAG: CaiB/BaiF CoA-transferase family protein [Burkholderiaceae bacterium]|nr:CaiB/BaiF CoA-transferase family protein [Burkholderiaceae bacterium]